MGDNLVNLRAGALGILSLLLAGGVSAGSDTASSQNNFGYKTIYIGQDADVKLLRSVLNDWEEIAEAIYRYQPRGCIKDNLTIESIVSVGVYSGAQKIEYLNHADISTDSGRVDRKSTRLNSSHVASSYAVFCLK